MAVTIRLTTFVTNAGVPVTGLSGANLPEVTIWNADTGALVQAAIDGAEIDGGFYGFSFVPTAGINYVARWDNDPQIIPQVTPQERYLSSSFAEFFDDVVPEGGSDDYGTLIQRLDSTTQDTAFEAAVHIDTNSGNSGTAFPLGTPTDPVDNLADALTIAAARGLRKFVLAGLITLSGALTNWRIEGRSTTNAIVLLNGQDVAGTAFIDCAILGNSTGAFSASRCGFIGTLDGIDGGFDNCTFTGTLVPAANGGLGLFGCYGGPAGLSSLIIDLTNMTTGGTVNCRSFGGALDIRNCNVGAFEASFEFVSGTIILASSLTAGSFTARGVVDVTDNSAGATVIVEAALARTPLQALIINDAIPFAGADIERIDVTTEDSAFEGAVHIDTINGTNGTIFPTGTPTQPVDNLANALTIAATRGIRRFLVNGSITLTASLTDWVVEGISSTSGFASIDIDGFNVARTAFRRIGITGAIVGAFTADGCDFFGTISLGSGTLVDCSLRGTMQPGVNATFRLFDCSNGLIDPAAPAIDLANANFLTSIAVRGFTGPLAIRNCNQSSIDAGLEFQIGTLTLEATVTAGTFRIRGLVDITDLSSGATVLTEGALARTPIGEAVWTAIIVTHDSAGTAAEAIEKIRKLTTNRAVVSGDNQTVTIYEDDDSTPAFTFTVSADLRDRTPD